MPLGQHVHYLTDKIAMEQKTIDDLVWEAKTPEDFFIVACKESVLDHLEALLDEDEVYYVDF
jgi:hypothetical protein